MIYRTEISSEKYRAKEHFKRLIDSNKIIEIKTVSSKRTDRQNRSLHLYFELLSEALNDGGFDMRKVIKETINIPFTPSSVKEYLWRPVQEQMFGNRSTTKLKTNEINQVYEVVDKLILERTGVDVLFPNWDRNLDY